jgi:hypothetical protein
MTSLGPKRHRWWLLIAGVGLCGFLLGALPSMAQTKKTASTLAAEREKYEEECATALQPVQKRYANRLKTLQKTLQKKGDKDAIVEIETELERLGDGKAQQANYPIEGHWKVEYTGGIVRNYIIDADGGVQFVEGKMVGHFTRNGDDILLEFNEDKLERLHWKTVLAVEHYVPKSSYGVAEPLLKGFAYKVK